MPIPAVRPLIRKEFKISRRILFAYHENLTIHWDTDLQFEKLPRTLAQGQGDPYWRVMRQPLAK